MTMSLDPAGDQWEIRQVIERYAAAVDRKDSATATALFTDDASFDMWIDPTAAEPTGTYRGPQEIMTSLGMIDRFHLTQHVIGNVAIDIDGDVAHGTTQCAAHHVQSTADGFIDRVMFITYIDRLVRVDGRWRFARRELRVRWTSTLPVDRAQPKESS